MASLESYEFQSQIGEGGFGRVFKAYQPALKREVAIKICTVAQEDFRKRFLREAEIAAGLRHPNIVTIYDIGEFEGGPYLVQEYLHGEDLDAVIRRQDALPLSTKGSYLRQIADGLAYAHHRGIMHRDIKPNNIRVLPDGQIRILDFGIAKMLDDDQHLTKTGFGIGTAGYMAPEQLRGERVDQRADIFSFGIVAYELLTYRKPFPGDTISAVYYQIAHEEPAPLEAVLPGCPPPLAAVVMRCLRKNPGDRFANCQDIVAALAAMDVSQAPVQPAAAAMDSAEIPPTRESVQSPPRRWRVIGGVAASVVALTLTLAVAKRVKPVAVPTVAAESTVQIERYGREIPALPEPESLPTTTPAVRQGAKRNVTKPGSIVVENRPAARTLDDSVVAIAVIHAPSDSMWRGDEPARVAEMVLDSAFASRGLRAARPISRPTGDVMSPAFALAQGRALGAAVMVTGVVSVVQQPGALGMSSVLCTLDVRAFDVRTGAVIADVSERKPGPGGSLHLAGERAVQSCARNAGEKVLDRLRR